jgi:hypothetical protein
MVQRFTIYLREAYFLHISVAGSEKRARQGNHTVAISDIAPIDGAHLFDPLGVLVQALI